MKAFEAVQAANDRGPATSSASATTKTDNSGFSEALMRLLSLAGNESPTQKGTAMPAELTGTGTEASDSAITQDGLVREIPVKMISKPEAAATDEDALLLIKAPPATAVTELATSAIKTGAIEEDTGIALWTASNAANLEEAAEVLTTATALENPDTAISAALPSPTDTASTAVAETDSLAETGQLAAVTTMPGLQPQQTANTSGFVASAIIHGRQQTSATQPATETSRSLAPATPPASEIGNTVAETKITTPAEHNALTQTVAAQTLPAIEGLVRKTVQPDAVKVTLDQPEIAVGRQNTAPASNSLMPQGTIEQAVSSSPIEQNNQLNAAVSKADNNETDTQLAGSNSRARQMTSLFSASADSSLQPTALDAAKAGLLAPTAPADLKATDTSLLSTRPTAPLQTPASTTASPDVMIAAGRNVQWMLDQGISKATMQLHPAELGSLRINIEVKDEQLAIQLSATQAGTRDALEISIPRLREQLAEQGFQDVKIDLGNHSDNSKEEAAHNDSHTSTEQPLDKESEPADTATAVRQQLDVEQGLVDMFA